jgi:hypothetical protein
MYTYTNLKAQYCTNLKSQQLCDMCSRETNFIRHNLTQNIWDQAPYVTRVPTQILKHTIPPQRLLCHSLYELQSLPRLLSPFPIPAPWSRAAKRLRGAEILRVARAPSGFWVDIPALPSLSRSTWAGEGWWTVLDCRIAARDMDVSFNLSGCICKWVSCVPGRVISWTRSVTM